MPNTSKDSAQEIVEWFIPSQIELLREHKDPSSAPFGSRISFHVLGITDDQDVLTDFGKEVSEYLTTGDGKDFLYSHHSTKGE